jgi:hypothetical protein
MEETGQNEQFERRLQSVIEGAAIQFWLAAEG